MSRLRASRCLTLNRGYAAVEYATDRDEARHAAWNRRVPNLGSWLDRFEP